jgi:hypothetical protein
VLVIKKSSHAVVTIACFLFAYSINNYQQAAAHNVVVDKLDVIEKSFCKYEIISSGSNHKRPALSIYNGDIPSLWNSTTL